MACVLTVAVVEGRVARSSATSATRGSTSCGTARIEKITRDHSPVGEREDAARALRSGSDAASAAQRGVSRRRVGAARARRSGVRRHPERPVRAGCGAAALQRRADRPGAFGRRSGRSSTGSPAIRRGRAGAHRRRQRGRRQGQRHRGVRRRGAVRHAAGAVATTESRGSRRRAEACARRRPSSCVVALSVLFRRPPMSGNRPQVPRLPALPLLAGAEVVQPGESISAAIARAQPGSQVHGRAGRVPRTAPSEETVSASSAGSRAARSIRLPATASEGRAGGHSSGRHGGGARRIPHRRRRGDAAGRRLAGSEFIGVDRRRRGRRRHEGRDRLARQDRAPAFWRATSTTTPAPALAIRVRRSAAHRPQHVRRNGMSERASASVIIERGAAPRFQRNVFHGMRADAFRRAWTKQSAATWPARTGS